MSACQHRLLKNLYMLFNIIGALKDMHVSQVTSLFLAQTMKYFNLLQTVSDTETSKEVA